MTLPEATGKVADTAINALRGNPLCLTVLLLVVVLAFIAYYRESAEQVSRTAMVNELISRCMEPAKR